MGHDTHPFKLDVGANVLVAPCPFLVGGRRTVWSHKAIFALGNLATHFFV